MDYIKNKSIKKKFRNWLSTIFKALLLLMTINGIASIESLLFNNNSIGFYPITFFLNTISTLKELFFLGNGTVFIPQLFEEVPIFTYIPKAYLYSMSILFASLILAIMMAFLITYTYLFIPIKFKKWIKDALSFADNIPDILIIMAFQFLVIYLYKKTGIKFLQIYSIESDVFLMPILCLMFVPLFMLVKMMITILDEEYQKTYVVFAKAKGLSEIEIFLKHVLRNVLYSFLQYLGVIYWMMLSNLVLVEYLFLIDGFTLLLYRFMAPEVFAFAIVLILIPYGFILILTKYLIRRVKESI
jgi:peptide/nickel transport system permease protein